MSSNCPKYGKAIYAYCLECEDKLCKNTEYLEGVEKAQKKSRIWQLLRNSKEEYMLNGRMYCDAFDKPYSYTCTVSDYVIYFYSQTKVIEIYKKKWGTNGNGVNLHYYYYLSPDSPNLFYSQCIKPITQEQMASLANRDWRKTPNYADYETNKLFLKYMKEKYIKCLLHHKQIIYDKENKKYISYDYYKFKKELEAELRNGK